MRTQKAIAAFLIFFSAGVGHALEADQILVIANGDAEASLQIAQYYCAKRGVPAGNILVLPLGASISETITRNNYEKQLAEPIRKKLASREFAGRIKCLLTTYGVPMKVGGRGSLKGQEKTLKQLKRLAEQEKNKLALLEQNSSASSAKQKERVKRKLVRLHSAIDWMLGKETGACVDSELSMVLFDNYELYRWQPNKLRKEVKKLTAEDAETAEEPTINHQLSIDSPGSAQDFKTLMVCRLDGPGFKIAQGLVDKALAAEKTGLRGVAYIDSRGITDDKKPLSSGYFDQSLRDLAVMIKTQTQIPVLEERTDAVFAPGQCPSTILYCGWYSLKNYVDAFDFVDGAIGYHIASWEAVDLHDPNSSQWCPAMLKDGITATLGAVAEPYLYSFPEPKAFFAELFNGCCLVEAYYRTKPFNSWQMVLIGDPLYKPFKKP